MELRLSLNSQNQIHNDSNSQQLLLWSRTVIVFLFWIFNCRPLCQRYTTQQIFVHSVLYFESSTEYPSSSSCLIPFCSILKFNSIPHHPLRFLPTILEKWHNSSNLRIVLMEKNRFLWNSKSNMYWMTNSNHNLWPFQTSHLDYKKKWTSITIPSQSQPLFKNRSLTHDSDDKHLPKVKWGISFLRIKDVYFLFFTFWGIKFCFWEWNTTTFILEWYYLGCCVVTGLIVKSLSPVCWSSRFFSFAKWSKQIK